MRGQGDTHCNMSLERLETRDPNSSPIRVHPAVCCPQGKRHIKYILVEEGLPGYPTLTFTHACT